MLAAFTKTHFQVAPGVALERLVKNISEASHVRNDSETTTNPGR